MLHARHTTAHATILLLALLAVAMWLPGGPAPLSTASASDDPPAADSAPLVRVIVQFAAPAVLDLPGLVRDERAKVDFDDPLAVAHDEYLVAMHAQWIEALGRACPNAVVDWTYRRLFDGAAVRLPEEQIAALQRMDGVVGVWPQGRYEALLDRSVPAMGVDEAWKSKLIGGQKKGGEGVKVAIVDYGVYTAHEFLDPGNMRYPRGFPKGERDHCTAKVVACRSFFRADDPPKAGKEYADVRDSGSHGTHIAGIIGGSPREVDVSGKHNISGIAPAAWLMAYKILYTSEKGEASVYDGEALAALEAVVDDGADVCNNSWGHPVVFHPEREPITMALANMVKAGITVVVAGGNHRGLEGECSILSPACHPDVITVASANADNWELEGRSSPGPSLDWRLKPDIVAPGVNVISAQHSGTGTDNNKYRTMSGTSMAAPHISGVCALLKQAHPDWSPAQIKSALMLTAVSDVVKEPGGTDAARTISQGAGRVAAEKALEPSMWTTRPSVSIGLIRPGQTANMQIPLHSLLDKSASYEVVVDQRLKDDGLAVKIPAGKTFDLAKGGSTQVTIEVSVGAAVPPGDYEGELQVTPTSLTGTAVRIPYWLRVVPATKTNVPILLIDWDLSLPRADDDYRKVWEDALLDTRHDCDVWDVKAQGKLPDFNDLMPYRAAIIYSGSQSANTGWSVAAASEFLQWLYAGHGLAVCGQGLPALFEARHIGKCAQIRVDGSQDLYEGRMKRGGIRGMDGGPWADMTFDLSPNRDNAEFLTKLRELRAEYIFIKDLSAPSLRATGTTDKAAKDGYVAFHRGSSRNDATPGKPAQVPYRIVFCTFGVESVSEKTRGNTRADFAGKLADWLLDLPELPGAAIASPAQVTLTPDSDNGMSFTAEVRLSEGHGDVKDVSVNWGDGNTTGHSGATAKHVYGREGSYQVTVEVTTTSGKTLSAGPATAVAKAGGAAPGPGPGPGPGEAKYIRGSREYEKFMEYAKLVLPAGHEAFLAGSVEQAIGDMSKVHKDKLLRFLDLQVRQERDPVLRDMQREFRKMLR